MPMPLTDLCFEDACHRLDAASRDLRDSLTRTIPALAETAWHSDKVRVRVEPSVEDGRRRRRGFGPRHKTEARLDAADAETAWQVFAGFGEHHGLTVHRVPDEEDTLQRYHFAARSDAGDEVRCLIDLPGPWNIPAVALGVFVGPRWRRDGAATDANRAVLAA